MDLAAELQKIYDSEINVTIRWLWNCGIEVRLGDQVNGFLAEETFAHAAGIAPLAATGHRTLLPPTLEHCLTK
jgi:hypothetical protein